MNRKGEMKAVGLIIALFIGVVVATTLLNGGIYENIGTVTLTKNVYNQTVTFSNRTVMNGQAVSNVIMTNKTGGSLITSGNYTIYNYDVSTGSLRTYLSNDSQKTDQAPNANSVNISYTYEPLGYAKESSSRAMVSLIAIFASLAVVVMVVWKIYQDGFLDWF